MLKRVNRYFHRMIQLIVIGFIVLLLFLSFFFAALQTKWAKKQLRSMVVELAHKNNVSLSMSPIEGSLPFKLTIKNILVQISPQERIFIKTARMRISPFALLRRELAIKYLSFHDASYVFSRETTEQEVKIALPTMEELHRDFKTFTIPFDISVKSMKVSSLLVQNLATDEIAEFSARANGKLKRGGRDFYLNCKINGPPSFTSYLDLFLKGNKYDQNIAGNLTLQLKSTQALNPFFKLPFDIDQKCSLNSTFTLSQDYDLDVTKFVLDSDFAEIKGKADIGSNYHLNTASISFNFPQLSLFSHYLPFKVEGALDGHGKFDGSKGTLTFSTKDLNLENSSYDSIKGEINSILEGERWNGTISMEATHPTIPIKMQSGYLFQPFQFFTLTDFEIEAPEAEISGDLNYLFPTHHFDCRAFAQIIQLSRFQELVPKAVIDGSFGAEAHFSSHVGARKEIPDQELKLHLIAKNIRYNETFVNEANLDANLTDLRTNPRGNIALELDKTFHPKLNISYCYLNTSWKDEQWPFFINAEGTWKDKFAFLSSGILKKEDQNYKISISEVRGSVMDIPFTLEKQCLVDWGPEHLLVEACDLKINEGFFRANVDFNKQAARANIKAEHFPLDVLALALPHFYLKGTSSLDIFLDATEQQAQGKLNFLLENANIYQKGKEALLNAKGALNIGLQQDTLQINANLIATDQQFFDWTATLPVSHLVYPFRIKFEENKAISSELTMEGKLEEIFDFVNFGTHQATGLVSCHLFLSKTLAAPSINGTLELQSGTYENYFTGTHLRDMNAVVQAENNKLKLKNFTGMDRNEGKITAQGDLILSPKEKFPFVVRGEVDDLNALHSELVTSNFTGGFEIRGNTESSLAHGSLTVSEAHFKIPETLPVDIPDLPIVYINQPPHIRASFVQTRSVYPMHLDFHLSAKDKIYVKGKGLDSEWHGSVHLTGTNTDYAARGDLKLLTGKFVFAGSTFTLSEGDIVFKDKPNPSSHISLAGTLSLQNISITAFLRGPLTAPIITFQSMPQMPTSSLLSYVLFEKDISEIDTYQAFQLAQVVVSLAGGDGPGVFEKIRKTLGVDKLGIVAGPKGIQQIGIQIGKYLTKGLLITLVQNAETSQVIVEVTLKEGFIFHAETQEENSGKFILKWHKDY